MGTEGAAARHFPSQSAGRSVGQHPASRCHSTTPSITASQTADSKLASSSAVAHADQQYKLKFEVY